MAPLGMARKPRTTTCRHEAATNRLKPSSKHTAADVAVPHGCGPPYLALLLGQAHAQPQGPDVHVDDQTARAALHHLHPTHSSTKHGHHVGDGVVSGALPGPYVSRWW